ncbi:MAG: hypothetical protein IKN65_07525 [Clostridia bacterium]|nr:hypothetical protein [Clostridia bacterium]
MSGYLIFCFYSSLYGCATFADLNSGLSRLNGSTKEEVFNTLGYPDAKLEIDSDTVAYVWNNRQTGSFMVPQTTNTTGTVGMFPNSVPFSAQTTTYIPQNYNYNCTIKYIFKNNRATNYEYSGNIDGCLVYINRLKNNSNNEARESYKRIDYASCLENSASLFISKTQDFRELTDLLESYCKKESSGYIPNLASYHARKAIDNYTK